MKTIILNIEEKNNETRLIGKHSNFIFYPNTRNGEELSDFLAGCEEITDNSHQIEKLEADKTLYRKVAVSERKPIKSGTYFSNEEEVYYRESTKKFEHNYDAHCVYPQWWLEEIPDTTAQLKADKAELLELMAEMKESFDHKAWVTEMELRSFSSRIESLIKKHKQ